MNDFHKNNFCRRFVVTAEYDEIRYRQDVILTTSPHAGSSSLPILLVLLVALESLTIANHLGVPLVIWQPIQPKPPTSLVAVEPQVVAVIQKQEKSRDTRSELEKSNEEFNARVFKGYLKNMAKLAMREREKEEAKRLQEEQEAKRRQAEEEGKKNEGEASDRSGAGLRLASKSSGGKFPRSPGEPEVKPVDRAKKPQSNKNQNDIMYNTWLYYFHDCDAYFRSIASYLE